MAFAKGDTPKDANFAKGGKVIRTKNSPFLKGEDEFREATNKSSDENWGKKGGKKK